MNQNHTVSAQEMYLSGNGGGPNGSTQHRPKSNLQMFQRPATTQLLSILSAGHELMTAHNRADLPKMITDAFVDMLRN